MRWWPFRSDSSRTDEFAEIRGLAEGLGVALLVVRKSGEIAFANDRAKKMFNFLDMEGRTVLAVTLSHTVDKLFRDAMATRLPQAREVQIRTQEDLTVIASAWADERSRNYTFLSLDDVTNLRRLERVRQDFVANVSHEIRTPLTTIRAMSEVITEVDSEDELLREKYLRQIVGEVDRLTLIVEDLLTLSIAESTGLRKEPVDLRELIDGVVLQLMPKAEQRGLHLAITGPETLPLYANPTQVTQVVLNLIDNALNYTNEGGVEVRITETPGEAVFSVSDTGSGIPSEDLPRIFERFYRVDKSRSRAKGGTGLGLSIVKHMVEAHGGRVSVESTLNRGTTFMVVLPRDNEESASLDENSTKAR